MIALVQFWSGQNVLAMLGVVAALNTCSWKRVSKGCQLIPEMQNLCCQGEAFSNGEEHLGRSEVCLGLKTSFNTIWRAYTNWLYILNNSLEFKNLVEKRKHSARAELNLLFTGKQHSSRFHVDLAFA